MADNTLRQINLLRNVVEHTTQMKAAYVGLMAAVDFNAANQFDFAGFDFSVAPEIAHLDNLSDAAAFVLALRAFMEANGNERFNQMASVSKS